MHAEDTPRKVCVQLWMTPAQRQQLRARAAAEHSRMTQCVLVALGLTELAQPKPPPKKPRRWKPKAQYVGLGDDPDRQLEEWVRAMESARGREVTAAEWHMIHALFLGVRSMMNLKPMWKTMREWRAGRSPKNETQARVLQALCEFETLRKAQYAIWDAETGHTSSKRRQQRAKNLETVRAQDAARQRKRYTKLQAAREAAVQAFVDEHVDDSLGEAAE